MKRCYACGCDVVVAVNGRCPKCGRLVWEALASVPGPGSPKLRTTRDTYRQPEQKAETEARNE